MTAFRSLGPVADDAWFFAVSDSCTLPRSGNTTAQGDVFGANFTAQNILLQAVPDGPWTVTTKLDHTAITVNAAPIATAWFGLK